MYKIIFYVLSLFLFCESVFSQNSISGKTMNQEQEFLAGTHIHIGSKTVSSDVKGGYSIQNLPNGATKIHVSYIGYVSIDTLVNLNKSMALDFVLKRKDATLEEIIVRHKETTVTKSVLEKKIKVETIERFSSNSLGDVLKEVAGVSSLKTGSSVVKPVINGLYGSRVPVLNNNVRLEDQQWGVEHAPNFDINAAGKITVIKGASGLQYSGDAIGGLVVIEPTVSKKDTLFGKTIANYNTNGRGGSISTSLHKGNLKGWSWNTLGTFRYLGDIVSPNYVLSNTGNRELNFTGDLKFSGKKFDVTAFYSLYNATIGILSASHIGNVTDLYYSIKNKIPFKINDLTYNINNPKQKVQHHIAKLSSNYYINETGLLSFQYAFQFNKRLEFDVRRKSRENTPALDLELATHSLNIDFKKMLHDWEFKTGLVSSYQNNVASPDTEIRPLIPNYVKYDFGTYGIVTHRVSDNFSLDAGIRFDATSINASKFYTKSRWTERGYETIFNDFIVSDVGTQWLTKPTYRFQNISASIGLLKEFESNLTWFANISLASRNPNVSELFSDGLHHATGVIELGDLGLKRERSVKFSTTFQKKWGAFSIDVNPYLNKIHDYMFLTPSSPGFETTIRGAFPVWEYQQTDALLTGIDVETNWNWNKEWLQSFSFAYVHGQDESKKQALIDMPPLTINSKIQFSKKEWHHLLLELKGDVVFGQNRFPNNDFYTTIIVDGNSVVVVVPISAPPPPYQLLHFYSEMKFKTFKRGFSTVSFSVQNMLNTTYRDYLNKQRFFADEIGRNIQIKLKINY